MNASLETRPVKVLLVCAVDISASKLLSSQARALEAAGFEVHIACSDGRYAQEMLRSGFAMRIVPIANRASLLSNLRTIASLYRLMRRERYRVVHVHMISAAFLGRVAAWLARTPLILYTFRGFAFYPGSSRRLKLFNLAIEKLCTPMTDYFFVQAEENRARGIRAGVIPQARSLTIGNGIRVSDFLPGSSARNVSAEVRRELGIPESFIVIGFVGRLVREKGIQELVRAVGKVVDTRPDVTLLFVGEALASDVDAQQELRCLIAEEGLDSHMVFAGFCEDMPRMYQAMDLFVLPSYREGAPRSVMEAMACGKPVVASDIAGCRDQVLDRVTGYLVPPRDPVPLHDAIVKLLEAPEVRASMGEAGRQRAVERFDERSVCERLVESYVCLTREVAQRESSSGGSGVRVAAGVGSAD